MARTIMAYRMKQTVQDAENHVVECLGKLPFGIIYRWSNRMTRTAGTAKTVTYCGGKTLGTVSLAAKIFSKAIRDNETDGYDQLFNTTVHELCHIYREARFGDTTVNNGHDIKWAKLMGDCGLEPEQFHYMKTGADLFVSADTRRKFHVGAYIRFQFKNEWVEDAHVVKHNPKNCRVYSCGRGQFNIPWAGMHKWAELREAPELKIPEVVHIVKY